MDGMEEGLDVEECAGYCGQMLELCEKMGRADLARYCHARCVRAVCRARTLLCLLSPPYISLLKLTRCCPVFACRSFYIRLRSECRACPACPAHILICSSVQPQNSRHDLRIPTTGPARPAPEQSNKIPVYAGNTHGNNALLEENSRH